MIPVKYKTRQQNLTEDQGMVGLWNGMEGKFRYGIWKMPDCRMEWKISGIE